MTLLEIKNLHASIGDTKILHGIDLTINRGEVHAIMGPNGSGKSTLSYVLSGRDGYEVTEGDILLDGQSVLEMEADERARAGMFLAFQYPVELPGVSGMSFLRAAVNARRREAGEDREAHGNGCARREPQLEVVCALKAKCAAKHRLGEDVEVENTVH